MIFLAIDVVPTVTPETAFSSTTVAAISVDDRGTDRNVSKLLSALNAARVATGLRPLVLDSRLCAIARAHGLDMSHRGYFDHVSPEGATPFDRLDRAHFRYGYAGENLALDRDAEAAHRAFTASLPHRRNMLGEHYARVGIAAVESPSGTLFVEDFSD